MDGGETDKISSPVMMVVMNAQLMTDWLPSNCCFSIQQVSVHTIEAAVAAIFCHAPAKPQTHPPSSLKLKIDSNMMATDNTSGAYRNSKLI